MDEGHKDTAELHIDAMGPIISVQYKGCACGRVKIFIGLLETMLKDKNLADDFLTAQLYVKKHSSAQEKKEVSNEKVC
jgi:hypothetical protein